MADATDRLVHRYSEALLGRLLDAASWHAPGETSNHFVTGRPKHQVTYLKEYLKHLGVTTIVEEREYIDRDFLEDFSAYHVRSFALYERKCRRLHFFSAPFTDAKLKAAILDPKSAAAGELCASYKGFVVVRPLPVTIIGRTCLATYGLKSKVERHYETVYDQPVNLYGLKLSVSTVAFQEQDRDVAACATSAIWSVLQKTGREFQHATPSPVAITGTAAATGGYDDRMLPAIAGLTIRQIADALRYVGLDPHLIPLEVHAEDCGADQRTSGASPSHASHPAIAMADDTTSAADDGAVPACGDRVARSRLELKLAAAAYVRAGLPCLLLLRVTETSDGGPDRVANHAVALTGYRIGDKEPVPFGDAGVTFEATRLDRLFVHDDHLVPFAKMVFDEDGALSITWPDGERVGQMRCRSHTLVVPLNHKIRIPFGVVFEIALNVAGQMETARAEFPSFAELNVSTDFEWDVRLSTLQQFREDVRASALATDRKVAIMTRQLPKYLWRIVAKSARKPALELVLDATDLVQGEMLLDVIGHDASAEVLFRRVFATADRRFDQNPAHRRIRMKLAELPTSGSASHSQPLPAEPASQL